MGLKSAIDLLNNIRGNLNEGLNSTDILVATAGTIWTNTELLECLNKGKDREWDIIRQVREDYFQTSATLSLTASTKEYSLASDFYQIVGIKCTTSGRESLTFRQVDQSTREFQERDALPSGQSVDLDELIYDIIAQSKIKFADFPGAALSVTYDYIQTLSDYTLSGSSTSDLQDVQREYREAYATWKALGKNPSDPRLKYWSEEVRRLEPVLLKSVSKRNIRESEYVEPY